MHYYSNNNVVTAVDFNEWWRNETPCDRDGCGLGHVVSAQSFLGKSKLPKNAWKVADMVKSHKVVHKSSYGDYTTVGVVSAAKYRCDVVDCGITRWCSERKVRRVVDHHIKEVTERKWYKCKPGKGLKGGRIRGEHVYVYAFDAREYDPLEH